MIDVFWLPEVEDGPNVNQAHTGMGVHDNWCFVFFTYFKNFLYILRQYFDRYSNTKTYWLSISTGRAIKTIRTVK